MKYTTVQGDTWDAIAKSQMGSEKYANALMTANVAHLNTFIFSAGITLVIPAVPQDVVFGDEIPPWRR